MYLRTMPVMRWFVIEMYLSDDAIGPIIYIYVH